MGHDICGFNKEGEEIAYARFSMGNYNALTLYKVLDAYEYYGGVSGIGRASNFSTEQMEKAWLAYEEMANTDTSPSPESKFVEWDKKQISQFIQNCLKTAQEEGSVRVSFG
ncbi:hypothetical protein [Bacillus piscicola]|uniref:hypothetical protein n=1 Tax=Bacillus piscicola TaxID=1632684 RepID=UPI001F0937BC|nr:hypothetical protein [Bacillus piscicola]